MGAFKMRGASNFLARLSPDARAAGVITYSSGNHGQAVALAAQRLGLRSVVVMPETAPRVKVDGVQRYGGEVMFAGTTSIDRKIRAEQEAAMRGLTIVPPFDHPWIIAGAGTCGLEILEQCPDVTAVYVPVGGGGLLSGIATAIKGLKPAVRVIGVEPAGAAKLTASRAAGHPVRLEKTASIADGLLTLQPGALTFAHIQALVDGIVTVEESEIANAVRWLFRAAEIVAEPSGAASVAAALKAGTSTAGETVAVISGGNVSSEDHARYVGR
jgi:threonine dehydratase